MEDPSGDQLGVFAAMFCARRRPPEPSALIVQREYRLPASRETYATRCESGDQVGLA